MFKPLSLCLGWRYIRAKKNSFFVSFISTISLLGIALGVMVLITVLSVMNGFDQQIRHKLFTLVPHVTVSATSQTLQNWKPLAQRLRRITSVHNVVPIAQSEALLSHDGATSPALVSGIQVSGPGAMKVFNSKILTGSFQQLKPGRFGVVLGETLASNLNVSIGDPVNIVTPTALSTPIGIIPQFRQFHVVGIFQAGSGFGFDAGYAFIQLQDAQKLFAYGSGISMLQIRISHLLNAPNFSWQLQKKLGDEYSVDNWTEQFGAFYHAIRMEKTMMFLILVLIIAVAVFNLVSSLMMVVNDKASDIAILRTIGMTPKQILMIFIIQGASIGALGVLIGLGLGIALSLHITHLVNWLEGVLHVQIFDPNVYFVDDLPSKLLWSDVFHVGLLAWGLSILATIYPALRASRIQPAEALRYE